MIKEIIFDIETKKLFEEINTNNLADLGVSVVSLYKRQLDEDYKEINGQIISFWEKDFSNMWPLFSNVDRVIGFNSLSFDIPILFPLCPFNLKKINHFDILNKIKESLGFRLSLDSIAKETLGVGKTDIGTNAVLYWNQGTVKSLTKLKNYCEADVLITKDIYDYAMKNGHLKYKDKWNTSRLIEIDFSYPKKDSKVNQMGLF